MDGRPSFIYSLLGPLRKYQINNWEKKKTQMNPCVKLKSNLSCSCFCSGLGPVCVSFQCLWGTQCKIWFCLCATMFVLPSKQLGGCSQHFRWALLLCTRVPCSGVHVWPPVYANLLFYVIFSTSCLPCRRVVELSHHVVSALCDCH